MKKENTNNTTPEYWFRKPANLFLIVVVFVISSVYLINPILNLLAGQ